MNHKHYKKKKFQTLDKPVNFLFQFQTITTTTTSWKMTANNTETVEQLKTYLNNLKSVIKSPRLYLSDFFTDLRNTIDIQCESSIQKLTDDEASKSLEWQSLLISEVDAFEKECLSKLNNNGVLTNSLIKQVKHVMTAIEVNSKTGALVDSPKLNEIKCLLEETTSDILKVLFRNQGIVFLSKEFLSSFIFEDLNESGFEDSIESFGLLVLIEDEYISSRITHKR